MGAISAIQTRQGVDAIPLMTRMVRAQAHRGADAFGVATPNESLFTRNLDDLRSLRSASTAIAYNLMRLTSDDLPQPRHCRDRHIIVESDYLEFESFDGLMEYLSAGSPEQSLARLLSKSDGQYTIVVMKGEEIYAARDPVGLKPLYYYSDSDISALSTERKGLWSIGLKDAKSFPPGHLLRVGSGGPPHLVREITPQRTVRQDAAETARALGLLLRESVVERSQGLNNVGVSFSGGIDSSAIAYLLSSQGVELCAFVVGMQGHPGLDCALTVAELLDIKVKTREYTQEDLEQTLEKCVWRTEEADPVKLSTVIPLSWSANFASENGVTRLFTGQGADELFAGYRRFLNVMREGGESLLREAVFERLSDTRKACYDATEQATEPERVKMLHPFADWRMIEFGLSISPTLMIQSPDDDLRKRILRRACLDLGLPKRIVETPKKAMQYSTGVDRCVRAVARKRGLPMRDLLCQVFEGAFSCYGITCSDYRRLGFQKAARS
ncbi:asparagine synthetase B [Candidatus Bathyarchaeota archaeon]|nr:asparagine synthetase B [Candidatus Bathyarchaeota archaeon]